MNKEKLILISGAALVGILVASGLFFLYQTTKKIDDNDIKKIQIKNVEEDAKSDIPLVIDEPKDESVVDERVIKVIGKTVPNSNIVVITTENEEAGIASNNGSFSMDIALSNDDNIIEIIVVTPNGEVTKTKRIVTYSTEDF